MQIAQMDYVYLRNFLRDAAGLMLEDGKEYLIRARLGPVARQEGFASVSALLARLRTDSSLANSVVEAMVTNETFFFRDEHPFDALRQSIFPEILSRVDRFNIWCAASSSGQEPYSIALLLAEHFPSVVQGRLRLLASDVSSAMLKQAQKGCYRRIEMMRGMSKELQERYFALQQDEWHLDQRIRQMVDFRQINLVTPWPSIGPMDVVLMRNVLIYFDQTVRLGIFEQLRKVLRPGGYLLLGASETLTGSRVGFEQVQFGQTVCYRRVADR